MSSLTVSPLLGNAYQIAYYSIILSLAIVWLDSDDQNEVVIYVATVNASSSGTSEITPGQSTRTQASTDRASQSHCQRRVWIYHLRACFRITSSCVM